MLEQQAFGSLFCSLNSTQGAEPFWAHQHIDNLFFKVQIYNLRKQIKICTSGRRDYPFTSLPCIPAVADGSACGLCNQLDRCGP